MSILRNDLFKKNTIYMFVFLILFNISFLTYFESDSRAEAITAGAYFVAFAVAAIAGGATFANSDSMKGAFNNFSASEHYNDFKNKARGAYLGAEAGYRASALALGYPEDFDFKNSFSAFWGRGVDLGADLTTSVRDFFMGEGLSSYSFNGGNLVCQISAGSKPAGSLGQLQLNYWVGDRWNSMAHFGVNDYKVGTEKLNYILKNGDVFVNAYGYYVQSFNYSISALNKYNVPVTKEGSFVIGLDKAPPSDTSLEKGFSSSMPGVAFPKNYGDTPPAPPPPLGLFPWNNPQANSGEGSAGGGVGTGDETGNPSKTQKPFDLDRDVPDDFVNSLAEALANANADRLDDILNSFTVPFEGSGAIPQNPATDLSGVHAMLTGITGILQAVLNWLLTFFATLQDLLKSLFVPEPDYMNNKFDGIKEKLAKRIGIELVKNALDSLKGVHGDAMWQDIYTNWMGQSVMILKGSLVNVISGTVRRWVSSFTYILLILYNYNQLYFMIRGTYPISIGKRGNKGDD